nr:unnamed protein product [Callosobruchus chinensis]
MVTSDVLYIEGYSLIRKDREVGRGGGVLIYIKDSLKYQAIDVSGNIEQLFVKINCRDYNFVLGVAYKPPTVNYKYFINSLEVSFTIASTYSENILFLGDVNINFLSADSVATKYFNSMLTSLGLNQLVSEPTHITDHSTSLIDIVLTNNVNFIDSTFVRASNFSLHECVGCNIKFMKPRNEPKYFTYRDFKNFDADSFHHDLSSSNLDHIFFVSDVDEKIKLFNSILTTLFEKHVPLKTIQITRRKAPWINDRIKMLMSERDKARAKLKRNKTDSNLKQYRDLRNRTNFEILKLKQEFFSKLSNVRDTKKVWNEFRQLNVNHTSSNHISDTFPDPDILNNHFVDSIPQSRRCDLANNYYRDNRICHSEFRFKLVSELDIINVLQTIKNTAPGADDLGINLIKTCCPYILPYLVNIISSIMVISKFPNIWKRAHIIVIPKCREPKQLTDLRPISILCGLSKLAEKIFARQLSIYLKENNILPPTQSGFREGHSCTTALLNITDDIFHALDDGECMALIMLDFSRAFDTINHETLLAILKSCGLCAEPLSLFQSYLNNRCQAVKIGQKLSKPRLLASGVPQGSVLGPLLFSLYTSQFPKFIKYCSVHMYADDMQIYRSFPLGCLQVALSEINEDLNTLSSFSRMHSLNLNPNKSVALVFSKKTVRDYLYSNVSFQINGEEIQILEKSKNLGLILDNDLRFRDHVACNIRKAYTALQLLYPHRAYLPVEAKKILCETLVLSQFNFCSPVYGPCIDQDTLSRLQRVQNSCIRFIFGIRKYEHVSHKLKELKWLGMKDRLIVNALCLFHKILTFKTPLYLYNKISFNSSIHNVNTRNKNLLLAPCHKMTLFERGFSFNIYRLYNSVPDLFKTFNYHRFKQAVLDHFLYR